MKKVNNYIYVLLIVLINSLAFADCEILITSFIPDYKESSSKADNAFIFFGSLNMEGFVRKDEINISEVNYNYLKVIDKIPFCCRLYTI